MKLNHSLILAVILIILFSLGTVAASENVTHDSHSGDALAVDEGLSGDAGKTGDTLNHEPLATQGQDDTDVSVRIDVKNVYDDDNDKFNQPGFTVPWNITAKVTGATAHNVKVQETLSSNMELISGTPSVGSFDTSTGIWDIGDLSGFAVLTIVTKLKSGDKFTVNADVTTDSPDTNTANNHKDLYIKSGAAKSTSNTTENSDNKGGADYGNSLHDLEDANKKITHDKKSERKTNSNYGQKKNDNSKSESTNDPKSNGKSSSGSGSTSRSASKSLMNQNGFGILGSTVSRTVGSLVNSVAAADNPNSSSSNVAGSNSKSDSSNVHVDGIIAEDYTKIPILIFALFLVIFVAIVGYGKIKS